MIRVLAGIVVVFGLSMTVGAQHSDIHATVQDLMPGFRIAEAKDYETAATPHLTFKDEGGQIFLTKDFDHDGRSDWALIAIDPAKHVGRACLFLNLGNAYRVRILREWDWNGKDFYSLHVRDAGKASPDQLAEARFAKLVSDKPLESFTSAERKTLQDMIKHYASGPSLDLMQYIRCLGCDLFGGSEYFFDADILRVVFWVH